MLKLSLSTFTNCHFDRSPRSCFRKKARGRSGEIYFYNYFPYYPVILSINKKSLPEFAAPEGSIYNE